MKVWNSTRAEKKRKTANENRLVGFYFLNPAADKLSPNSAFPEPKSVFPELKTDLSGWDSRFLIPHRRNPIPKCRVWKWKIIFRIQNLIFWIQKTIF
jgi:hypothetical protein